MPKQTLTTVLEVPEGWELTGELRVPQDDEPHLDDGCVRERMGSRAFAFPILRPTPRVPKVGEVWEQFGKIYLIARNAVQPQFVQAVDITGDWTVAWNTALPEDVLSHKESKFLAPDIATWAKQKWGL